MGHLRFHKEPNIQFGPGCLGYGFVKVDKAFLEGKKLNLAKVRNSGWSTLEMKVPCYSSCVEYGFVLIRGC